MPSRRSHTNSHHGCLRCKSKRVKCDQTQPTCLRCQKRGAECIYRHLMSSYDPFVPQSAAVSYPMTGGQSVFSARSSPGMESQHSEASSSAVQSTAPAVSIVYSPSSFTLERTEQNLLHHYMNNLTGRHMAPVLESRLFPVLNPAITRNAVMHPYVQEAVLCYSALHLASSAGDAASPQRSAYLVTALRHKATALAHFRPMLASGITAENCEAAFTASAVLVACAFALPIADPVDTTHCDRIELLAQVIGLFRGCVTLFQIDWKGPHPLEQFRSPQVTEADIKPYSVEISWPDAERAVAAVLNLIRGLDESTPITQYRKAALVHAATGLHKVIRRVATTTCDYSVVCGWLGRLTPGYAELLRHRDPLALVLMAHWCASRQHYSDLVWWTRGWPESALTSIMEALDGRYSELLGWCLSVIPSARPQLRGPQNYEDQRAAWSPWIPA